VPYMKAGQLAVPQDFLRSLPRANARREDDWINAAGQSALANQLTRIQLHEVHQLLHNPQPVSVSMATIASLLNNGLVNQDGLDPGAMPGFGEIDVSRIIDVPDFDLAVLNCAINPALLVNDRDTLSNLARLLQQLPAERLAHQDWSTLFLDHMLKTEGLPKAGQMTRKTYWELMGQSQSAVPKTWGQNRFFDLKEHIKTSEHVIKLVRARPGSPHAAELIRKHQTHIEVYRHEYETNRSALLAAIEPLLTLVPAALLASPSVPRTLESLTQARAWKVNV